MRKNVKKSFFRTYFKKQISGHFFLLMNSLQCVSQILILPDVSQVFSERSPEPFQSASGKTGLSQKRFLKKRRGGVTDFRRRVPGLPRRHGSEPVRQVLQNARWCVYRRPASPRTGDFSNFFCFSDSLPCTAAENGNQDISVNAVP